MLECRNLNIHYGKLDVVRDVSFEVEAGELVSIIGGNGAGKSTIIDAISGLKKITSGTIRFLGNSIEHMSSHEIVNLGIIQVPERRLVYPQMSVLENMEMGAYRKEARAVRRKSLEFVLELFPDLAVRKSQMAGTLSGGQQQMLAIARGLMSVPRLLLLDEPSLGLAPLLVEDIFKAILKLNARGMTIVLVEQNVYLSLAHASRAHVLEEGRITMSGPGKGLLEDDYIRQAYLGI